MTHGRTRTLFLLLPSGGEKRLSIRNGCQAALAQALQQADSSSARVRRSMQFLAGVRVQALPILTALRQLALHQELATDNQGAGKA